MPAKIDFKGFQEDQMKAWRHIFARIDKLEQEIEQLKRKQEQ